ncbi:hypothetical protein ACWGIP_35795, partial [Streptomyces sp. NPDC054838]
LTDPAGLGWAARGPGAARAGWLAGLLTGRESLAVSLAVCGLKTRIRAAGEAEPALLADPDSAAVFRAVEDDRQGEAVRLFRAVLRERGAERAFGLLAPSFADILAWDALTDDNPFNDHAGWQIATGRSRPAPRLLGLGAALRAFFGRGPGRADPVSGAPDPVRAAPARGGYESGRPPCDPPHPGPPGPHPYALDTSATLAGYARNLALIGAAGTVLVQQVAGPDGVPRHVVQLASPSGPAAGSGHHRREAARIVRVSVPSGTELALVGSGEGGAIAMELAADRDFTALYTVTHVVTIGSPPRAGGPADPGTAVFALRAADVPAADVPAADVPAEGGPAEQDTAGVIPLVAAEASMAVAYRGPVTASLVHRPGAP